MCHHRLTKEQKCYFYENYLQLMEPGYTNLAPEMRQ